LEVRVFYVYMTVMKGVRSQYRVRLQSDRVRCCLTLKMFYHQRTMRQLDFFSLFFVRRLRGLVAGCPDCWLRRDEGGNGGGDDESRCVASRNNK
jgi:hypothetical protein